MQLCLATLPLGREFEPPHPDSLSASLPRWWEQEPLCTLRLAKLTPEYWEAFHKSPDQRARQRALRQSVVQPSPGHLLFQQYIDARNKGPVLERTLTHADAGNSAVPFSQQWALSLEAGEHPGDPPVLTVVPGSPDALASKVQFR